ncbi:MAG TPA: carbohydrate ABC transporter substrate-binding protein [Chloroflexota bacterium]|nr:carbohydrate ABC transporter substrate-binding protein [Chloroflexota bacterium]
MEPSNAEFDPAGQAGRLESRVVEAITRRQLLRAGGLGLAGVAVASLLAACGGGAAPAAKPTEAPKPAEAKPAEAAKPAAPVAAQPTAGPAAAKGLGDTLNIVQWSHFVPAYDTWFDKYAEDWGNKNKVKVTVDHVPNLEMPARLAAEASAKAGHDIMEFQTQVQTYRYEKLLVDVGDIADYGAKKWGPPVKLAKDMCQINGVWRAVPDHYIVIAPLVRDDLMQQIGNPKLETWDDIRLACGKLKPQNNAAGLPISNCNDANHNWRAIMWSFGASETDAEGKNVTVNTKEFREFLKFAKAFYDEGITPEVFAWDDASDNRWLGSGQGSFIHDAISSLRSIEQPNKELFDKISIHLPLKGPAGQITMNDFNLYGIWDFAKNKEAAKQFLMDYYDNLKEAIVASTGYNMPVFENLFQKPMPVIGESKKLEPLQEYKGDMLKYFGYPGPPNAAAQEVNAAFHIPQLVGIYVRGKTDIEDVIKEAESRLKPIYDKYKT